MATVLKVAFLTVFVVSCANSDGILPVKKCKLNDKECLKTQFQAMVPIFTAGMPELGVEVLDALLLDDFHFDLAGLKFGLKNARCKGLKDSIVDGVNWDLKKKVFTIDFHADTFIKGHYTAGGRVLILPITGDGEMKFKLKNVQVRLNIFYEMGKGDDGKQHVKPTKYTFDFEVKDHAHYHLSNLFNGNKELSDVMLTFLNENWKQISVEFGRPIMDEAAKKIFKNIIAFFDKLPIEDIADVSRR